MDDKIYLMLKEAGFETGFQNTFIANNSAKFDKFVELIREDERANQRGAPFETGAVKTIFSVFVDEK